MLVKYVKLRKSVKVVKWVGNGRGASRLVQNDQRNYRKVFKQVLAKDSLNKTMKNMVLHDFSRDFQLVGSDA